MTKPKSAQEGIARAWGEWLYDHPITVGDLIESAVKAAVTEWLNAHGEALFADATTQSTAASDAADQRPRRTT